MNACNLYKLHGSKLMRTIGVSTAYLVSPKKHHTHVIYVYIDDIDYVSHIYCMD